MILCRKLPLKFSVKEAQLFMEAILRSLRHSVKLLKISSKPVVEGSAYTCAGEELLN
jgi:hypothetical protein